MTKLDRKVRLYIIRTVRSEIFLGRFVSRMSMSITVIRVKPLMRNCRRSAPRLQISRIVRERRMRTSGQFCNSTCGRDGNRRGIGFVFFEIGVCRMAKAVLKVKPPTLPRLSWDSGRSDGRLTLAKTKKSGVGHDRTKNTDRGGWNCACSASFSVFRGLGRSN